MPSRNLVLLMGHVGRDPVIRAAHSGTAVSNFSLATNERRKDGTDHTEWHAIVCFGQTATFAADYIHKGDLVDVEGRIQTRTWETDAGEQRKQTQIIAWRVQLCGSKRTDAAKAPGPEAVDGGSDGRAPVAEADTVKDAVRSVSGTMDAAVEDDLPF